MNERSFTIRAGLIFLAVAVCVSPARGADWPTFAHDSGRTGCTQEQISNTLHKQWTYIPAHAPSPAWPDPVREAHTMDFDYCYQVAVAGGVVYFGSSADHHVYALDLATGKQRWSFATDAPIRFAPTVTDNKVFVASDDGCVYCLKASDGKLVWRFRGGPRDERVLGNEHMISRWPLRSGLLVEDDTVYVTAGMWPLEGISIYALNAVDGSVLKKIDNCKSPLQGYLSAHPKKLIALAGRADVVTIDRTTLALGTGKGWSQAVVRGDWVFTSATKHKANEHLPNKGGVSLPARHRSMMASDVKSWKRRAHFNGMDRAVVSDDACYLGGTKSIAAYELAKMKAKWAVAFPHVYRLAVAGKTLVVGGENKVALLETSKGDTLWSHEVEGQARGLAVADGHLLVSTHTGRIVCFGPEEKSAKTVGPKPESVAGTPRQTELAKKIVKDTGKSAGFCLMLGVGDGGVALELAKQSDLRIYCAEPDEKKVAAARTLLARAGLYGARVTVHHVSAKALPYPKYFADLVVLDEKSCGSAARWQSVQVSRIMRPCGGAAYLAFTEPGHPSLKLVGKEFQETRVTPTTVKVVRGKLAGAGEWTHQYANANMSASSGDQLARWPLKMLWFGKPGPGHIMNRHLRGPAPLSVNGRMFVLGEHRLMAFDCYNGRALWHREIASAARRVVNLRGGSMAADEDSVYLLSAGMCLRIDAETGKDRSAYRLPFAGEEHSLSSPLVVELDGLGKATLENAPDGLQVTLTTPDSTAPKQGASWELFFDFRPNDRRNGFYGPGVFQAIVTPPTEKQANPSWKSGVWSKAPELAVSGKRNGAGSKTTVMIRWADIRKLVGDKPADFRFGVILNSATKRTYRFADGASYRLANCGALVTLDANNSKPSAKALEKLLPPRDGMPLEWGSLMITDDLIVGTAVATIDTPLIRSRGRDFSSQGHDYATSNEAQILHRVGVANEAKYVFAIGKQDGRPRWVYRADRGVPHNGIAIWKDRVYLLDRTDVEKVKLAKRRGEQIDPKSSLRVLDLATGKVVRNIDKGVEKHVGLRLGSGVLLVFHMKGMTVYDANDCKDLWSTATTLPLHHATSTRRVPIITSNRVYDEPNIRALRTGKVLGKWKWAGHRNCGSVSASEHLLLFRHNVPTICDVSGESGSHGIQGIRPGCHINMITAGGLVLMPEASSGCACGYSFQTTIVMAPAE